MRFLRNVDSIGGAILIIMSGMFAITSLSYPIGSILRMGPGFFPFVVSIILATIGLAIIYFGSRRTDDCELVFDFAELRPAIFVLLAVTLFGLALEPLGLVPASFLLVFISALAQREIRVVRTILVAVVITAMAAMIFVFGLGLPIALIRWPL